MRGGALGEEAPRSGCYLFGSPTSVISLVRSLPAPMSDAAPFLAPDRAGEEPTRTLRIRNRVLPLDRVPLIMGILNVTPDSFSDGGSYSTLESAVSRAEEMIEQGADIIDVGGESTRPASDPVPAQVERQRVVPVIDRLRTHVAVPISIDTYKASVASEALSAGASIVNDVTGLRADPAIAEIAAAAGAALIVSHIRGTPKTMNTNPQYDDLMHEIASELLESAKCATRAGVPRESIVIDPGIGFGKTFAHNAEILRRLPELAALGLPVLVGASRKSFLGAIVDTPPGRRLEGSLAAAALARQGSAAIVRVHDVAETRRFLDTLATIAPLESAPRRLG
jgi:dihydropteroate synthase